MIKATLTTFDSNHCFIFKMLSLLPAEFPLYKFSKRIQKIQSILLWHFLGFHILKHKEKMFKYWEFCKQNMPISLNTFW